MLRFQSAFRQNSDKTTARLLCWMLAFSFLPRLVSAQAELRADSAWVETGNPFALHLRIPASLGTPDSLEISVWAPVLPAQNIVAETGWEPEGAYLRKTLTALFFDADTLELPALPLALRNGDTAFTNTLQIIVVATPSPDDLNDLAPIKDILREPARWTDYLSWILGVLAVLGLLALLFWLASRQSKARVLSRSLELPAHVLALKKLDALAEKHLLRRGFVKEHYAELTHIAREYLEKRFNIPALESTTEETLNLLGKTSFPTELLPELRQLLSESDLAKFAKIIPDERFHDEAFDIARRLVHETVPAPEANTNAPQD